MAAQETIKQILMRRDNLTATEADDQIEDAHDAFEDYLDEGDLEGAENICQEFFGLEPDYLHEIM